MYFHLMMGCCKSSFTQFAIKFFAYSWIFIWEDVANPVSHDSNKIICLRMNWNNMSIHLMAFCRNTIFNKSFVSYISIWWVLSKPLSHSLQFNFLKASGIILSHLLLRHLLTEPYKIWLNDRILGWTPDFLDLKTGKE